VGKKKKTAVENGTADRPSRGCATIPQACAFLSLSRATIYNLMDRGELAYAKMGTARRIPWKVLEDYLERCTVAS